MFRWKWGALWKEKMFVDYSIDASKRVPLHLSPQHLRGHSLLLGALHTGKTTLMAQMAKVAMRCGAALVVIDEEGDLAPDLVRQIPRWRARDVTWINLNERIVNAGWNVLDMTQGDAPEIILENFLHTASELWDKYWNWETENAVRIGVLTLLTANRVLAMRNEKQFTLLDLPRLFEMSKFRHRILKSFVIDPTILGWWNAYDQQWEDYRFTDPAAALVVPLHRLSDRGTMRDFIGRSTSTMNWREMLQPRRISLINTNSYHLTSDLRRWFNAILVDRVVRTSIALGKTQSDDLGLHCVVAINGNIPLPILKELGAWANLRNHGVGLILSSKSLEYEEARARPGIAHALVTNADNLFVFRTRYVDAEVVHSLLGELVSPYDLTQMPGCACYVRHHLHATDFTP
jgi:hypothetical protein